MATSPRSAPGKLWLSEIPTTFGWGNNLGDTWEKVLARKLAENGKPTEVYNLGRPGAGPQDYLDIAKTYIPLLKPRLIIVALSFRAMISLN